MEEEKSIFDLTKDDLLKFSTMQRKIFYLEEYFSMRNDLLNRVMRVLDLRDILKITLANNKRTRKILNKYAKPCKKENDVKKLFNKMELHEKMIGCDYIASVMNLMELVHKLLTTESFEKDIPVLERWYEFKMEDMILVNDVIRELDNLDSNNVTEEDILDALNVAVSNYIYCLTNNIDYLDTFDNSFPFVKITKEGESNE